MHHGIMVKVNGNDLEDAKKSVEQIMEETLRCGHCGRSKFGVNWDYFNILDVVDEEWIKENRSELKELGVVTPEQLGEYYRTIVLNKAKEAVELKIKKCIDPKNFYDKDGSIKPDFMLGYYLEKLEEIGNIQMYGDSDDGMYTLHCNSNHYADLTEYTSGEETFYIWVNRHY